MVETALTKELVLRMTGKKSLIHVTSLDLNNMDLTTLYRSVLSEMKSLQVLNVSNNKLTSFPSKLDLRHLVKLDISDNAISDLMFVSQFPLLQELYVTNNPVTMADKYIATALCPDLKKINNNTKLWAFVNAKKTKLAKQVSELWEEEYADEYPERISEKRYHAVVKDFQEAAKRAILSEVESGPNQKFMGVMVDILCSELTEQVQSQTYRVGINEANLATPKHSRKRRRSKPKKIEEDMEVTFTSVRERNNYISQLPDFPDYEPIHFIRCHSGDKEARKAGKTGNDPTDDITRVWVCVFEPHPTRKGETTEQVATIGGNTVCLIDCGSGKVMRRFRQEREEFYAGAWTTLMMKTGESDTEVATNILAVGGWSGHLRLLHPDQNLCYKELGNAGRPNRLCTADYYIHHLLFHPINKTHLFSGATDRSITLWDIKVPTGSEYKCTPEILQIFHSDYKVVNMAYSPTLDHLTSGCMGALHTWKVNEKDKKQQPNSKIRRDYGADDVEFELPEQTGEDQLIVDGLTLVDGDDIVACKCTDGPYIYIWRLSHMLKKEANDSVIQVKPQMTLLWKDTDEEFLGIQCSKGVLCVGDDKGQIWLYNLQDMLRDKTLASTSILEPSRIIEWPACEITSKRKEESQMTDVVDIMNGDMADECVIVNCSAISSNHKYVVSGTDNNLVCIYKQVNY